VRRLVKVRFRFRYNSFSSTNLFCFSACRRTVQTEVQVRPPRVRLASTGPDEDGDQLVRPLQRRLQGAALR
jgi:hypothetical protein